MKTWYVGTATPSHTGTYMVLETPEGRGAKPYVVHMEGFTGYLSTRFFTSERDWRFTGLFNHPKRSLARVEVRHLNEDGQSYMLSSAKRRLLVTSRFGRQSSKPIGTLWG